jgi:hypothetical protein
MATPEQKAFCGLQLFLFSGPSDGNFSVIPHLPTALGIDISSFRQRSAFVKGKVQDVHVCQKKEWSERNSIFSQV